jgi:hypothetical protein
MSYVRPERGYSNVYVFESDKGFEVWLWADEASFNATVPRPKEAAALLRLIEKAGYLVPDYVVPDLLEDQERIDRGEEPENG